MSIYDARFTYAFKLTIFLLTKHLVSTFPTSRIGWSKFPSARSPTQEYSNHFKPGVFSSIFYNVKKYLRLFF